ncbi:MAG: hypothetical protein RL212_1259 [Pseudomonadota bacterium]|jgi:sterol desaturase/sphingolipid hydroxylase (fatty acid hydroxylase superfamily)
MYNFISNTTVQHAIFICALIAISLPNIVQRKNEIEFRRQIVYDASHFFIYQSILGAYISYLSVFYFPILLSREIAGLLNLLPDVSPLRGMPQWCIIIIYFIYWDFLAYIFHRTSHNVEILWKIHKYHHSTIYFTGFTAYRVSFIENGLRICFYTTLLLPVIGQIADPPPWIGYLLGVFTFTKHNEYFCKKNFYWWPEFVIQSPRMHWLHHSLDGPYGKNFAEFFSVWDVLFGTNEYTYKNRQSDFETYKIGVKERVTPNYYNDCIDIWKSFTNK